MAIPRVFISSTCYDLKHIRESLKYFVKTIGYDPVLSDDGDVYYNPSDHTHDSCLKEVETCQLFILIVGGRYGGKFKGTEDSITNTEYREAVDKDIPVFALVESAVYSDHHVYLSNKIENPTIFKSIAYPSVDNIKIFEFIDEVRKHAVNNAIFPFNNFLDVETYLRKQWAGMMFDFLQHRSSIKAQEVTNSLLDGLNIATKKSEELITLLLEASDTDAEQKINQITKKYEAKNFPNLIRKHFRINLIRMLIDEVVKLPLKDTWYDYLEQMDGFSIYETLFEGDNDHRVYIEIEGNGLFIGHYDKGQISYIDYSDFEKAYSAYKEESIEVREEIMLEITYPF